MSDPMEPPPWAFEDCADWTAVRGVIEASGVEVKQIASWRFAEDDATRGENFRRFDLFDAETSTRLFSVIVEARAEAGFILWLEGTGTGQDDLVESLLRTARQCLSERNVL